MLLYDNPPTNIINGYRCGACWDLLSAHFADDRKYKVTCVNCGDHVPGLVSVRYVERRQAESHAQYIEARLALKDAWPFLFPKIAPIGASLKLLGF